MEAIRDAIRSSNGHCDIGQEQSISAGIHFVVAGDSTVLSSTGTGGRGNHLAAAFLGRDRRWIRNFTSGPRDWPGKLP